MSNKASLRLHKRCDVFMGYGAAGVIYPPEGKDKHWLATHCWVCGISLEELDAEEAKEGRTL